MVCFNIGVPCNTITIFYYSYTCVLQRVDSYQLRTKTSEHVLLVDVWSSAWYSTQEWYQCTLVLRGLSVWKNHHCNLNEGLHRDVYTIRAVLLWVKRALRMPSLSPYQTYLNIVCTVRKSKTKISNWKSLNVSIVTEVQCH